MDETQLRSLFSSLAELTSQGPLPVQAYSMLVTRLPPSAVAEQLHQRWLADYRFAPVAASILLHMHRSDARHLAVMSSVLALLLNDFKSSLEVRHCSRLMYRNSVRATFAMYQAYAQIDSYVAKSLVSPMFSSLMTLIDNDPDAADVEVAGLMMCDYGKTMYDLNSYQVDSIIVKIREMLISDEPFMNKEIRQILLHAVDLWSFGFSELHIPECLSYLPKPLKNHENHDRNHENHHAENGHVKEQSHEEDLKKLQKQLSRESTV
ncbi:hypothetical protein WR25_14926 [Diploscapter pachys]|uniref:MIF4G domain-containing protein n=1 Tax=Diploscapter pachys TaxID=2018661 RepID=A0A2A2K664_9BILA|nr:hypothetical protein WR25_14926 [Diploscapter pachys]